MRTFDTFTFETMSFLNTPHAQTYLVKPALVGAAAAVASRFLVGGDGKLPLLGMEWSPSTVIGVSCAGASIAAGLSHDYVLKMIKGQSVATQELEAKALAPVLSGLATVGAAYLTIGPVSDFRAGAELFAIGAGSEIAGSYAHGMIQPMMMGQVAAFR
jgi:hypothetical protein